MHKASKNIRKLSPKAFINDINEITNLVRRTIIYKIYFQSRFKK